MKHIDGKKGRFLTILPQTRKEDRDFREWLKANEVPWKEIWRRERVRGRKDVVDVYRAYEWPLPSAEQVCFFGLQMLLWSLMAFLLQRLHDSGDGREIA